MSKTLLLIVSILFFNACSTIDVTNDYDPAFSFDGVQSYAILYKSKDGSNTLTDERIMAAIDDQLSLRGYTKQKRQSADIYVVFHTNVQNKTRVTQDYQRIGVTPYRYGRYYGYAGMMSVPVTRTYNYDEGKLLVDILDSKEHKIVWRGVATDTLKKHKTPEDRIAYINEVMMEIFKTLPSNK